jgi:hypothetical protein
MIEMAAIEFVLVLVVAAALGLILGYNIWK